MSEIHFHFAPLARIPNPFHIIVETVPSAALQTIKQQLAAIMKTQAELTADLQLVAEGQKKTAAEIKSVQDKSDAQTKKIEDLEKVIADLPNASDALIAAVEAVKQGQADLDAAIPDLQAPVEE